MKWLGYAVRSGWWKLVLGFLAIISIFTYLYRLLRPADDQVEYLDIIKTEVTTSLKENQLRGRLEKDKIGAVKTVFESRLKDTKEISDREERLRALIRLNQELDI